jgi:phage tail sheath gpL-like
MAYPDSTTLAPAYGFELTNQALSVSAANLPRKGALLAQYDPDKTGVVDWVPKLFLTKEQVGFELGFGSPAHRMAMAWSIYGSGIPMWIVPMPEDSGATPATWTLTVTVTTAKSGTVYLYIGDDLYEVGVTAAMTDEEIAEAITDVVNAETDAPVTAAYTLGVVTLTAKAGGTFGNGYIVTFNYEQTQSFPGGVSIAAAVGATGATDPDIQDALDGMGMGDEQNMRYWTDCVTSNGLASATLQACSTWNGIGNTPTGNYAPSLMRPTRFLSVSTEAGNSGFTNMKSISDANTYDRTNCIVGAPDHQRHPVELACEIMGYCAATAQAHPHMSYIAAPLRGHVGTSANRWTRDGTVRETAIRAGIATTKVLDGTLVIDGLVTMYRPSNVAPQNNLYRSFRNVAITQNLSNFHRAIWEPSKNKTIVDDVAEVDATEKDTCMDLDGAKDLNNKWADESQGKAWIYDAAYTKKNQLVILRDLSNGFDHVLPVVYSAEGVVSSTKVIGDISLAVVSG